jgi:hypothetical protein
VAITAPPPLGLHPSPPLESVAVMEPSVSFCRRGFIPRSPSSPLEVGEFSREGVFEEAVGSLGVVFDATLCLQVVGISFEGNVNGFLYVAAQVVEEQRLEVPISTPKFKGKRELQYLECHINYVVGSLGSTRSKSKRALAVM